MIATCVIICAAVAASPLKHDAGIIEAKELLFNRTVAAKIQHVQKIESALNKTLQKLTDMKNTFDEAKNDLKEKILGKVAQVVEKLAAVGDKFQQTKTNMTAKMSEKWQDIKDRHRNKTSTTTHRPSAIASNPPSASAKS